MALKNEYGIVDTAGFAITKLSPGEIAVQVVGFTEGKDKEGKPYIRLDLELHWTANEEDEVYNGSPFQHAFFFGRNAAITIRQLRDFAKGSGCNIRQWSESNQMPESIMLPSFIKLLAWKRYVVLCKVVPGKESGTSFLNFIKVLRNDNKTGAPLADRPPDGEIPHDLILEAYKAELSDAAGNSQTALPF